MDSKIRSIVRSFSYVIFSNLLTVLTSSMVVLVFPRIMGVTEYSYWQLYIFYLTYIGFFHIGWIDGIYLKYGGIEYDNLNRRVFSSQIFLFCIFLTTISISLFFLNTLFVTDSNVQFIYNMTILSMLVTNLRAFYVYILQMTNRLRESSMILISDRVIYLVLLFVFILLGSRNFNVMIWADVIGRSLSLFISVWTCRDLIFNLQLNIKQSLIESFDNIKVGINLMLSNIASSMIIGVIRFGIQWRWSIETFGKVSLTLSISNLLMTFINAMGLVVFPQLKRAKKENLPSIYSNLRNILMIIMFAILITYYPLKIILDIWLPSYRDTLVYMAFVFPMSVYEGKMALIINPYLKALRMEKEIFKINLLIMTISVGTTTFLALILNSLELTVVSIVILLALRSIIAELVLSRKLNISVKQDIALEFFLTFSFILTSWYLPILLAAVLYVVIYFTYVYIKKSVILRYIHYLKDKMI